MLTYSIFAVNVTRLFSCTVQRYFDAGSGESWVPRVMVVVKEVSRDSGGVCGLSCYGVSGWGGSMLLVSTLASFCDED